MSKKSYTKSLHYGFIIGSCALAIGIGSFIGRDIEASFTLFFQGFQQSLAPKTFPIDFSVQGNKYAGSIIITSIEALPVPQIINFGTSTISCNRKIKGYYFNTARGLRTRPLDQNSLTNLQAIDNSYNTLTMVGGIYTSCIGQAQDVVGYIGYNNGLTSQGGILFGVTMISALNTYNTIYNPGGFIIEDYKKPKGYMYDTVIGIGYSDGNTSICIGCDNGGGLTDTFWHLAVQGRLGLSKVIENNEKTALKGNIGKKSLVYSTDEVTSSTIINLATKNAEIYCRGGTPYTSLSNIALESSSKGQAICIDVPTGTTITIDNSNIDGIQDKDLIVRNGNVFIDKEIYKTEKKISLFIDKGSLILDNSIDNTYLKSFDKNGFISTTSSVTKGIYLKGNYIINGLVVGANSSTAIIRPIDTKTFIEGKLTSLNLPTTSNPQREKQLNTTLRGTEINGTAYKNYINLENLFTRRCNPTTGFGDVTNGTINTVVSSIPCNGTGDIHYDRSLIVIEKEFPSILFKR